MYIRIFGLTGDSVVDGPGLRLAVFVQGCEHACKGCHNPGAHSPDGGAWADTGEILDLLQSDPLQAGLTLSGGEPFLQPAPCRVLAEGARSMGKNVWIFTGFTWEEIVEEGDPARLALLRSCDVLVDGRFELAQRTLELLFRGSRNQRLIDVQASLRAGRVTLLELPEYVDIRAPM